MLDLPEGFRTWTTETRLAWHEDRIEREAPVFEMLERAEIFTCFDVCEIKARLHRVRFWSREIVNAIEMQTSPEFLDIKKRLDEAVAGVESIAKKRCRIMIDVFKKGVEGYAEEMARLKTGQEVIMEKVESREMEMLDICLNYHVHHEPYLVYDRLREKI